MCFDRWKSAIYRECAVDKSKILIIGLGVGCILLGGLGAFALYQGTGLRAEVASKQSALDSAQERIHKLELDLKQAKDLTAKAQAALAAAKEEHATAETDAVGANSAETPAAATGDDGKEEQRKKMADMMKGPFGEMISKQTVNMMYGDLLKEMVLTPSEREALNKLLVEETMANQKSAEEYKAITDPKLKASYYSDRAKETEAKIQTLLGDQRLAQYKTYKNQIGERMMVKQFEGQIALSQTPLSGDQKKQLIQIMVDEREKYGAEKAADKSKSPGSDMGDYQKTLNQRVNSRLGTVLMPDQLKELSKWQDSMAQLIEQVSKKADPAKTEGE